MNHLLGGTGYITHLATIWPEHDLAVWALLESGDYAAAQRKITAVNWPWLDFRAKLWRRTGAESPVVKAALELCGRPGGPSRLPTRSLTEDERAELRELLARLGVALLRAPHRAAHNR
jgi:dihydrodipicolinate synthase/N-acetylneuraminate lyase